MEQSAGAGNQQVSRDDLLRLATIFDCEGSVTLSYTTRPTYKERVVAVTIGMSVGITPAWISDTLRRLRIRHYYQEFPPRKEGYRPQATIDVHSLRTVKRFHEGCGGFLLTKRDEMAIAMEYVDFALSQIHVDPDRLVSPGGVHIAKTDAAKNARQEKFEECRRKLEALRATYLRGHSRYIGRVITPER